MSDVIRELKALAAQDAFAARQLGNAVDALELCFDTLRRNGFKPEIYDENELVTLHVDLSLRVDLQEPVGGGSGYPGYPDLVAPKKQQAPIGGLVSLLTAVHNVAVNGRAMPDPPAPVKPEGQNRTVQVIGAEGDLEPWPVAPAGRVDP